MESIVLSEPDGSRRLLVAFAHPDDESFGPAGTLVHYASQGVSVHLACATRGEAGEADEGLLEAYDSVGELRTQELLCAARRLGLAGVHFLGYGDSGMENSPENRNPASLHQAPLEEVAEKLTRLIRLIGPQVVLTHDPSGGYFHPDHIKVHQATVEAFHSAADPGRYTEQLHQGLVPYQSRKLYYTAFPRGFLRLMVRMLPLLGHDPEAFGRNGDVNVKRIAEVEQVVTTKIPVGRYREASQRAAQCHASQMGGPANPVTRLLARLVRFDTFSRAVPPFEDSRVERDLFAGIEDK